jgi:uncharacterized protein YnzC (UPF0291/DUF896 family)
MENSDIDKLERLAALVEKGLLTADEFAAQKAQRKAISRGTCPGTTADLRMS